MRIQVAPHGRFDAQNGLEVAIYDEALARAARLSLSPHVRGAVAVREADAASRAGVRLSQATLLRFYRRALVHAIRHRLMIVLAPCACAAGLNTYHALPSGGGLRHVARQQALADMRLRAQR